MKKFNLLKAFSVLAISALAAGIMAINSNVLEASATNTNTFEMQAGAWVRLPKEGETEYGIKYAAQIHKDEYVETDKYYVMIIPTGWLTTYDLKMGCDYYDILVNQNKKNPVETEGNPRTINIMESAPKAQGDYYTISGSIVNIKYENTYREFFGIVYKTDENGENRVYADFDEGENVRSISNVASAALNINAEKDIYTSQQKSDLLGLVKDAYNASIKNEESTEDLPTISATSVSLALEKDKNYQLNAINGIPEKLGIDVNYVSSDPTQVAVTDEGLLTIGTATSEGATVTATVLGKEYTVATVSAADNMLVDFDVEGSTANILQSTESEWLEDYDGRQGVVKTSTTSGGTYGNYKVKLHFDVTKAYMESLDFDYISIWAWIDEAGTWDIRSHEYNLETGIEGQKWQEIRIYQEEITTAKTTWYHNFGESGARNAFNSVYASDTYNGWSIDHLFQIRSTAGGDPKTVYIDSVSYVKFEVEEYDQSQTTGEFTLPTVSIYDNKALLSNEADITVTQGTKEYTVENGKVNFPYVGTYSIMYNFNYSGVSYCKELSINVVNGTLEDFGDSLTAGLYSYGATSGAYYEEYNGRTGVVGNTFTATANTYLQLKFDKTEEELKAILCADGEGNYSWDYITMDICITRSDNSANGWIYVNKDSNRAFGWQYTPGTWVTIKLTREQIVGKTQESDGLGATSIWGYEIYKNNSNQYPQNAAAVIEKFCEMHCSSSTNASILMLPSAAINGIYIDSISIGKDA